jgi:hypothetical protein
MNAKFFILGLFTLINFLPLFSQPPSVEPEEFAPPSPNASSLGIYGQMPVGLFTGTPQINIPLYSIDAQGLTIPISLSYSSNGIRVSELASVVGLGWSLNAGGVITRSLNDNQDELYRVPLPDVPIGSQTMNNFLAGITGNDQSDTQPDIFAFNFNGYSGKFYLDNNMEARLISPEPLGIELLPGFSNELQTNPTIKITTADGMIYWFGGTNAVEYSHHRNYGNVTHDTWNVDPVNSWYLKTIELLNGNTIDFVYEMTSIGPHDVGISQYATAIKTHSQILNILYQTTYSPAQSTNPVISEVTGSVSCLTQITWDRGQVIFTHENMFDGVSFERLKMFTVLDKELKAIKKIKFDYQEYTANPIYDNPKNPGRSITLNTKRLFLEKVTDITSTINPINPYIFEYYSPDGLPNRLSFSQDYWGYFNGKINSDLVTNDVSQYNPTCYDDATLNYGVMQSLFKNVGGNRNADGNYGKKGLLKKVTYPTGGYNIIEYEPHSITRNETRLPPPTAVELNVENDDLEGVPTHIQEDQFVTAIIPYVQEYIPVNIVLDMSWACADTNDNPNWNKMIVSVTEHPSNNMVPLWTYSTNQGLYVPTSLPGQSTSIKLNDALKGNYFINLYTGKSYTIKIHIERPCLRGYLSFNYYAQDGTEVLVNKEVGGVRIAKVITNDGKGNNETKHYYYGDFDCLECSSAEIETLRPAVSFRKTEDITFDFIPEGVPLLRYTDVIAATLSSSTLNPIYNSQGYHIGYPTVIEGLGENFENGAIKHTYNIVFDQPPLIYNNPIPGTAYSNCFGNGEETQQVVYKHEGNNRTVLSTTNYSYIPDNRLGYELQGFNTSERYRFNGVPYFDLSKYKIRTQWRYLKEKINKQFDENGQNPFTTTTTYNYDNEFHLQTTSTTTTNSNEDVVTNKIYYPDDVTALNALPGEDLTANEYNTISLMKHTAIHRVAEPIQTEIQKNGEVLSRSRTLYNEWNGQVLRESIQISKDGNPLEDRVIFYNYDIKGNPLQVSRADDYNTTYLWGYNYSLPIAKIINATYDQVLLSLQNSGVSSYAQLQIKTNSELSTLFYNLRRNSDLSDALIHSYTYDQLVGLVTETDPNDNMLSYDYDGFNRLNNIRNMDGDIVKNISYNYEKYLQCSPGDVHVSHNTSTIEVKVITNITENIDITESADWFSVSSIQGGVFNILISANTVPASRSNSINISAISLGFTINVYQDPMPVLNISPETLNLNNTAGTETVSVNSNIYWSVFEAEPWITITPSNTGINDGSFIIDYDANNAGVERTTLVTVSSEDIQRIVTITQEPAYHVTVTVANYPEKPLYCLFTPTGHGSMTFNIESNTAWQVFADQEYGFYNYSYTPNPGTGNGSITISGTGNDYDEHQLGKITITGGISVVEIIIEQDAK